MGKKNKVELSGAESQTRSLSWYAFLVLFIGTSGMFIGGFVDAGVTALTGTPSDTATGIGVIVGYLLSLFIVMRSMNKKGMDWREVMPFHIGISGSTALKSVLLGFTLIPVSSTVYVFTLRLLSNQAPISGNYNSLIMCIYVALIGPIFEEIVCRGFLMAYFKKTGNVVLAIVVSSLLFGLTHGMPVQIIYAAMLGIFMAIMRQRTGSMWTSTIYHIVNNSLSVLSALSIAKSGVLKVFFDYLSPTYTSETMTVSIVTTLIGAVLSAILLFSLKPTDKAKEYEKQIEEKNVADRAEVESTGRKFTLINPGFIALCILILCEMIIGAFGGMRV